MMNSVEANRVMEIVTEEEKKVKAQADHVEDLKKDAEKVLNEALPVLKDAQDALNTLDRGVKQSTLPSNFIFLLALFRIWHSSRTPPKLINLSDSLSNAWLCF